MHFTRAMLKAVEPLDEKDEEFLVYKQHHFADLVTVASPKALLARAKWLRSRPTKLDDGGSTAAHLELAAETISELLRYL